MKTVSIAKIRKLLKTHDLYYMTDDLKLGEKANSDLLTYSEYLRHDSPDNTITIMKDNEWFILIRRENEKGN